MCHLLKKWCHQQIGSLKDPWVEYLNNRLIASKWRFISDTIAFVG